MTNQYGVEIKGIEEHFICGHRLRYLEPLPILDPKLIERVSLSPDDFIRFTDLEVDKCLMCRMNDIQNII